MDSELPHPGVPRVYTAPRFLRTALQRLGALVPRAGRPPTASPVITSAAALPIGDLTRLIARRVMVPRTEIAAVPYDLALEQLVAVIQRHPHSRYPVFDGSLDNIVGIISAKQVLAAVATLDGTLAFSIRDHMNLPLFVPRTMRADRLLAEMKQYRCHIAIVLDEYGTTAGLVTFRDVMEQLVGEEAAVPDEWEAPHPELEWLADGSALVAGLAPLAGLEEPLGVRFAEPDFDTLGGFMFGRLGRRPVPGDAVRVEGCTFLVDEMDGLRVARVRVVKPAAGEVAAVPAVFLQEPPAIDGQFGQPPG